MLGAKIFVMQSAYEHDDTYELKNWQDDTSIREDNLLTAADFDESILEKYMNNRDAAIKDIDDIVLKKTIDCELIPVFKGVAISDIGVTEIMNYITKTAYAIEEHNENKLSAIIYKVLIDEKKNKKIYFRLYGGELKIRQSVKIYGTDNEIIIRNLEKVIGGELKKADSVQCGNIGVLTNIKELKIGDILGEKSSYIKNVQKVKPILISSIKPKLQDERYKLIDALNIISEEDPYLDCIIDKHTGEIKIHLLGEIQKEFIKSELKEKYNIEAEFLNTKTIFKECPVKESIAEINMGDEGNNFNASITLKIEPLKNGSGFVYESKVSYGYLRNSFQKAVEDGVRKGLEEGINGWSVTDIKVSFIDAYYNSVTSAPSDFRNLAPIVLKKALLSSGTAILKPILIFSLLIPEEAVGKVLSDVKQMNGKITDIQDLKVNAKLFGQVPLETFKNYMVELNSYTKGKGIFSIDKIVYK